MSWDHFPPDPTQEWWDTHWHSLLPHRGYGDPRTAVYYSFLMPTHAVVFLAPFTDLSRLVLVQVRPVSSGRPRSHLHPDAQRRMPPTPTSEWHPVGTPPDSCPIRPPAWGRMDRPPAPGGGRHGQ